MNSKYQLKWSRAVVLSACISVFLSCSPQSHAQLLVAASGNLARIDPPRVMRRSNLQDDKKVLIVEEQQGYFLSRDLAVDVCGAGTFNQLPRNSVVIPSGTMVNCTLAFVNPDADDTAKYDFSLSFASPILGVITTGDRLQKTNLILGNSSTNYPNQIENQGMSLDGGSDSDSITISNDRKTATVHITSSGTLKMLRILTGGSGLPDLSHLRETKPLKPMTTTPVAPSHTRNQRRYRRYPTYTAPTYTIVQ